MITNHNAHDNRKDGFKLPKGYLESFDQRLFERIKEKENQKPSRIISFTPRYFIAIAATLTLLVGLGLFIKTQLTSSISNEALETYLEYNPSYTLSNEFIQAFDEGDIKELEQAIQINQHEINEYVQTNIDLDYYLNY